jgi:hypothetical protein
MSILADIAERVRALVFPGRRERELAQEMTFHLEREIAERVRQGTSPEEARRGALLAFGGEERYKEETRGAESESSAASSA